MRFEAILLAMAIVATALAAPIDNSKSFVERESWRKIGVTKAIGNTYSEESIEVERTLS